MWKASLENVCPLLELSHGVQDQCRLNCLMFKMTHKRTLTPTFIRIDKFPTETKRRIVDLNPVALTISRWRVGPTSVRRRRFDTLYGFRMWRPRTQLFEGPFLLPSVERVRVTSGRFSCLRVGRRAVSVVGGRSEECCLSRLLKAWRFRVHGRSPWWT